MPIRPRTLIVIALVATALHTPGARAQDPAAPTFSFSGFGTLGEVHSSEDEADFKTSFFKPNGAGHSRRWSADVDSVFGVQVIADFTPRISAVVQVVSEQRYDNSYTPKVEWANVKYQFTEDFSMRAGRVVMPVFLVSEYRKVGYANTWVRAPVEVYSALPITNNDGVETRYRLRFGEVTNTLGGIYGGLKLRNPDGTRSSGRNQWAIFNATEVGPLTLSVAYFQSRVTVKSLRAFFDGFRTFGPQGSAIADKHDCDDKKFRVGTVGASYDPGAWFLTGEWARRDSPCFVGDVTAWYASGGYRLGKLTPYLTHARTRADGDTTDPGLTLSALLPALAGPAAGLNAGLNAILGAVPDQKTVSVGVRWDFARSADLKLEFSHSRLGAGSPGVLTNARPGFRPGGEFNLLGATIDFVF